MNKTAILRFILDEVALKARNVSTNMRKRIHWMLKYKEITVKEYDERAIVLNGWIRVGKEGFKISKVEEMKKGVSNYILETAEQLERVMTLNNKIRCCRLDFYPNVLIEVESIERLSINKVNYDIYSKCSFNKAKDLLLYDLSTEKIKFILSRFKSIDKFKIFKSSLENIDFSQSRIKQFCFSFVSLEGFVYLPREIEELQLYMCKSPNLIKAQRVNNIDLTIRDIGRRQHIEMLKTLKRVKVAKIDSSVKYFSPYLPSTIRKIESYINWNKIDELEEIVPRFPYLIETTAPFPIELADKIKMRVICPIMSESKEKFSLRPRKIEVYSENIVQLNNHPELFEKVEYVVVNNTNEFNFDILSNGIKSITVANELNEESITLNRL